MDLALVSSAFDTLRLDPPSKLTLLEARTLSSAHVPSFPPDMPALLMGVESREQALHLKTILLAVYPGEHVVYMVSGGKKKEERLGALRTDDLSETACLFIPALAVGTSLESFAEIVAHLRAPDGCPWDREQTHESLRNHLLEESYETLSAIDSGDVESMREEFGDLLLHIFFNAQIAHELDEFLLTDVIKGIYDKIVRRHPHVFGNIKVDDVNGVLQNWEKLKEDERRKLSLSNADGKKEDKGLLDGVPMALPALIQAQEYQARAARVGFDWPEIEDVLDKVREEIEEIKQAQNMEEVTDELGDLFFVLVNLARWKKVDAESALRGTNMKFKVRFGHVEQSAKKQGRNLSDMTLEEMDTLWQESKKYDG
ncbi:MAG: nucleoside triphosphate pyrophosphohydrolase [Anaerolineales bacterium]|nr:nucleoside triphosphate pyrophosphohydrolase [Anaerolineales bacterium]